MLNVFFVFIVLDVFFSSVESGRVIIGGNICDEKLLWGRREFDFSATCHTVRGDKVDPLADFTGS